ncbi:DUF3306 domain-containing protein [Bradyrhizobium sp. STM 3562]|uniref:DUF3306 domain-containing protein n=1 Tax=Bradyrhizobium sp. STM 3562 TaxID=578924 RepID=UPI0038904914
MSGDDFLARWSRRKQEARAGQAVPQPEKPVEVRQPVASAGAAEEASHPELDLASLPPVDSIDAATDITAFLRKGIPQELSRAALRRAWSSDPAIRDFVGLAESAWDFNDPDAMPGFGPLDYSAEQLAALVHRIVGGVAQAAESISKSPTEAAEQSGELRQASEPAEVTGEPQPSCASISAEPQPGSAASQRACAMQGEPGESEGSPPRRRTHGGALPR